MARTIIFLEKKNLKRQTGLKESFTTNVSHHFKLN